MAAYEYEALNANGKTVKGVISGDHPKQIRAELRAQGLTPLDVKALSDNVMSKSSTQLSKKRRARIKPNELSIMTRQMATLLESGMTIEETLATLIKQSEGNRVKGVISDIRSLVTEGQSLSEAVATYPTSFPEIYRASIAAGEESGTLDKVLDRLADYLEDSDALRKKITQAIAYPIFLLVICTGILILLITLVVPKVVKVYQDTGQDLPLLTKMVIRMSDFLVDYGVVLAAAIAMLVVGVSYFFRQEKPRYWLHGVYLKLSGMRKMIQNVDTARMARTLSIMVGSGVPILASLRAGRDVMSNTVLRHDLHVATEEVAQGVSIGRALDRSGNFPPLLVHMVASGENSGRLDHMLDKAATATENEMQTRISMMVSLLGPLMILIMGGLVFLIVMAILMPIFDLNSMLDF